MKLDRGLPTDLEDVRFLVSRGIIELSELQEMVALSQHQSDEPNAFRRHWMALRRYLGLP